MRIAQLAPPHTPTPPTGYGASELIASLITEELVRRGHDVTLFAAPESTTAARLVYFPETLQFGTFDYRELVHAAHALRHAAEFDVVHNHCLFAGPALAALQATPCLSTLHYVHPILAGFPGHRYVAVSESQRAEADHLNVIAVVPNAIDLSAFTLRREKEDYLLFLGRFHPNKGTHLAIDVAERLGMRLVIAAPLPPPDKQEYFAQHVAPRLGGRIEYVGEVAGAEKDHLLGGARALILPLQWPEPFGLVLLEAMACGTPAVALNRGAAAELIVDGQTGFLAGSMDDLVAAVERAGEIDPAACRRHVAERFTVARMVDDYERLYRGLVADRSASRRSRRSMKRAADQPKPGAAAAGTSPVSGL